MRLNPKLRNELIETLSQMIQGRNEIEALLARADVSTSNIDLTGTPYAIWTRIITYADTNKQIGAVIKALLKQWPQNPDLKRFLEEFNDDSKRWLLMIAKAIKNGQCILFLGPDILKCETEEGIQPFSHALAREFGRMLRDAGKTYDEDLEEDLKYMVQRFYTLDNPIILVGDAGKKALEFYQQLENDGALKTEVFDQLKQLSFPLVINTNPDNLLFEKLTADRALTRYYDRANIKKVSQEKMYKDEEEEFQEGKTIIYNIFGSFDRHQSVLFTESDFVNFTRRVFCDDPPLLDWVTNQFNNEKYYLFLGFEFNQWHLKFLFEVLNLDKKDPRSVSVYMDKPLHNRTQDYYEKEFKFFFCNKEIPALLKYLIEHQ